MGAVEVSQPARPSGLRNVAKVSCEAVTGQRRPRSNSTVRTPARASLSAATAPPNPLPMMTASTGSL
jgi:hypothetical protein